jgi:flagellar FliJ protein
MTTLDTLLRQAETERDQAVAALRQAEDQADRARTQVQQLSAYRSEYQQRWADQFSRRGAIEIVHCYQSFTQRLDEALRLQDEQVAALQAQGERLRQKLVAAEMRVASVRRLIGRRQAELHRERARGEQRQTDEAAQQSHWRAASAGEPAQS